MAVKNSGVGNKLVHDRSIYALTDNDGSMVVHLGGCAM